MNKQLKRLGLLVTAAMIGAAGHVFAADILNVSVNGSRYMEDSGITRLAGKSGYCGYPSPFQQ